MFCARLWTNTVSAWKKVFDPKPSPEYQYRNPQVLCVRGDSDLHAPLNYSKKFPQYLFIPEETIEHFEERASRMSQISSTSIVAEDWYPSECSEWIYQSLVSIGATEKVATCEANRCLGDGLCLLL